MKSEWFQNPIFIFELISDYIRLDVVSHATDETQLTIKFQSVSLLSISRITISLSHWVGDIAEDIFTVNVMLDFGFGSIPQSDDLFFFRYSASLA